MQDYMGLYYPFMEFSNDAWVKLAALYWDKLGRIVPKGYKLLPDSPTVKQLTDELGFIKNLHPTVKDLAMVSNMFLEMLHKHRETLVKYYGIDARSIDDLPREETPPLLSEEEERLFRQEKLQNLLQDKEHLAALAGKMSNLLFEDLEHSGFIHLLTGEQLQEITSYNDTVEQVLKHKGDLQTQEKLLEQHPITSSFLRGIDDEIDHQRTLRKSQFVYNGRVLYAPIDTEDGKRIIIHPKLAFVYIEALADHMASTRQLHLVTDDVLSHVATSGYTVERLTQALLPSADLEPHLVSLLPQVHEIETQMATIALQSVIPHNLADISVKKIIQFRTRYRDEMIALQDSIHALSKDMGQLREIEDAEALKTHLEIAYERSFKPQLTDFRKSLKSLGIETATGVMSVQVALPALLASTLTSASAYLHLAPLNPIVVGAGAVACSIFPVVKKKQEEAKQMVRSSPVAYLFYAQEQLEPVNVATRVAQQARKLLFRM